jgi:hypothetical protein
MGLIPIHADEFYSPLAIIGQSESAMWHSLIGPHVILSLVHQSSTCTIWIYLLATNCTYHIIVRIPRHMYR